MMCNNFLDCMPFTYHIDDAGEGRYKVDYKAIINGLIIAAVTGMVAMFGVQAAIKTELRTNRAHMQMQLNSISADVEEIKHGQEQFRRDFYLPRNLK